MTKLFSKVAIAAASLAISAAIIEANPVQAASISYDLEILPDSGPLANQKTTGFFSYDDANLMGVGEEFLPVTEIEINLGDNTYNQSTDFEAAFLDGDFLGLSGADANNTMSLVPGFFSIDSAYLAYDFKQGSGAADMVFSDPTPINNPGNPGNPNPPKNPTDIPEPSTLLGLGILSLGLLFTKKKAQV